MAIPKCSKCGKGVMEINLHRSNPKGETPAIWECDECFTGNIDAGQKEIVDAVTPPDRYKFKDLQVVKESSIEARLYQLIDDIDTAFDIFKPEQKGFERYVLSKIREKEGLLCSDGYKLYYDKSNQPKPTMEPVYICLTCKTVIGPIWDDFDNKCDCDTYDYQVVRVSPVGE